MKYEPTYTTRYTYRRMGLVPHSNAKDYTRAANIGYTILLAFTLIVLPALAN